MQGKSFVSFFTIALLLVVSYIFILTIPTWQVESNADDHANNVVASTLDTINGKAVDKEEVADLARQKYLDSISDETVFNIGVKSYTYTELKRQQLALGLDLRGGMSVVMQVDLVKMIEELAGEANKNDPILKEAIQKARERQASAQVDFVTLLGQEYKELTDKSMARLFLRSDKLQGIELNSTTDEVIKAIREEASKTVERTFNLLKKRIDKFGVAQPTVSLDPSTDRITVELPGVRSPERARKFLQQTANLEFWPLYTAAELLGQQGNGPYVALNEALKKDEKYSDVDARKERIKNVLLDSTAQAKVDSIKADSALAESTQDSLVFDIKEQFYENDTANAQADLGPLFNTISVIPPQEQNDPFRAFIAPSDVGRAMDMLNSDQARRILPRGVKFVLHEKVQTMEDGTKQHEVYALKTEGRQEAELTGETVTQSFPTSNPSGFGYAVSLSMDSKGARLWKEMTEENVGKSVAVVLDDKVYSAPRVNEVIPNGNTSISGNFTASEATDLANILSIGKLPAEPVIIEEAVVGPTLGQQTVTAGLLALTVGFVLVLVFMLFYYGKAGLLAVGALFLNIFLIFGCLASFGTVLTLPGIAGIVLTIGMAVDANVIIFERIREELRNNELWKDAVLKGFKHSYSAIIDANVTTFVVALILLVYGLGPIKGFATVLMIGVGCSVFSAVLFGRLLFDRFLVRNKEVSVWNNATKSVLASPTLDFIKMRKYAYVISGILLVASIISISTSGFDLGVDFKGGRSYTVEFSEDVKMSELRANLAKKFNDDVVVKSFGSANQAKITTSFMKDSIGEELAIDSTVLSILYTGVAEYEKEVANNKDINDFETFRKGHPEDIDEAGLYLNASSKVGPTIADDIQQSAVWASLFSLLFIFAYILIRFRRWQFSVGAIAALFHDVIIVLGLFSLFKGILPFSLEIDQAFIAAILTIIGYSINDTVIVFDRIRETATDNPDGSIKTIVSQAINSTLSRTVITSLTTFFVVFILFLFGGDGIAGFAFALFVGIIIGTYSSMFIASPIIVDTTRDAGALKYSELEDEFKTDEELAMEATAEEGVETTEEDPEIK